MDYRVGIYDRDISYVTGLMRYFNAHREIPITLFAFTDADSVKKTGDRTRLALLLAGESTEPVETDMIRVPLWESRRENGTGIGIYKYQSADLIAVEILRILKNALQPATQDGALLIACISPFGRCGKTTLAKGICAAYAESLYVNMEDIQPQDCFTKEIRNRCETQLYYIVSKNKKVLSDITREGNSSFDSMLNGMEYTELHQLTADHIAFLCEHLRSGTAYKRVVFDLGLGAISNWNILSLFDRIYVPVPADADEREGKQNSFLKMLGTAHASLKNKINFLAVPQLPWGEPAMTEWIKGGGL